jgi:hypothetical protein
MAGGVFSCPVELFNREMACRSTKGANPTGKKGIPRSKGVMNLHNIYEEEEFKMDELTEEATQDLQGTEHQITNWYRPHNHDLEEAGTRDDDRPVRSHRRTSSDPDDSMESASRSTSRHDSLPQSSYSLRTSLYQSEDSCGSDARRNNTILFTSFSPIISPTSSNEIPYGFPMPPTLLAQIPASSHQGPGKERVMTDCSMLVEALDLESQGRSDYQDHLARTYGTRAPTNIPAAHMFAYELGSRLSSANKASKSNGRSISLPSFPVAWPSSRTARPREARKHGVVDIDIERTAGSMKAEQTAQVGQMDSITNMYLLSLKFLGGPVADRKSINSTNTTELGTVIHHSFTIGDDTMSSSMVSSEVLSAHPYRSTLYRVSTLPDAESVLVDASSYNGDDHGKGGPRYGQWARRWGANVGAKIRGAWYRMVEMSRVAVKTGKGLFRNKSRSGLDALRRGPYSGGKTRRSRRGVAECI